MRNLKFVLSTLAILLAGALAAGMAARAVAAPRAGETVSAGVVGVPSVLGQTADEVLFYPWSRYDGQSLAPLEGATLENIEAGVANAPSGAGDDLTASIAVLDALEANFDLGLLLKDLTWNQSDLKTADMVFLKDFPATLDDGTPVLLSYALSFDRPQSVSWLMMPRDAAEPSEERRQAALDKVKDGLAGLLWAVLRPDRNFSNDMYAFLRCFDQYFIALKQDKLHERLEFIFVQAHDRISYSYFQETVPAEAAGDEAGLPIEAELPSEPPPVEELLDRADGGSGQLQFISTQDQIVALFTSDIGIMLGVYYDIQLGRYSGLGISE